MVKNILVIISCSIFLAVVYNFVNPKSLPWIPKEVVDVSDSILDAGIAINKQLNSDTIIKAEEKISETPITESKVETSSKTTTKAETEKTIAENDSEDFPSVSYKQVVARLNNPEFVIIDARTSAEFKKNHIPGAINMDPYGNEDEFMNKLFEEVPRDKRYIIYCHGGKCDLSHMVADKMKQFGFQNIFIFTGGWEIWTKNKGIKD